MPVVRNLTDSSVIVQIGDKMTFEPGPGRGRVVRRAYPLNSGPSYPTVNYVGQTIEFGPYTVIAVFDVYSDLGDITYNITRSSGSATVTPEQLDTVTQSVTASVNATVTATATAAANEAIGPIDQKATDALSAATAASQAVPPVDTKATNALAAATAANNAIGAVDTKATNALAAASAASGAVGDIDAKATNALAAATAANDAVGAVDTKANNALAAITPVDTKATNALAAATAANDAIAPVDQKATNALAELDELQDALAAAIARIIALENATPIPNPTFSFGASTPGEEGSAKVYTLNVTRDGLTGILTGSWAVTATGGTAANAADFGGTFPSGTWSMADGVNSATITITPNEDADFEGDETYLLTASRDGSPVATVIGTITNDDASPDITPPTLTSATDSANSATGGILFVATNEPTGTLYWFVSTSATPPTATALKAGTGAVAAGTQPVVATGAQDSIEVTGLTGSTNYWGHFLHRDAAGNDSAIVSGNGFTTAAAETFFTLLENGDKWLLENGDKWLLEQPESGEEPPELAAGQAYITDPADGAYITDPADGAYLYGEA